MDSDDLCSRCLIHVNTTSMLRARYEEMGTSFVKVCENITRPRYVRQWATALLVKTGGDAIFELDTAYDVMRPVTTWYGDPVCSFHLWECRDRETNYGNRANPRR